LYLPGLVSVVLRVDMYTFLSLLGKVITGNYALLAHETTSVNVRFGIVKTIIMCKDYNMYNTRGGGKDSPTSIVREE
jgi:hypothetical protein